jgi:hypothetical protein
MEGHARVCFVVFVIMASSIVFALAHLPAFDRGSVEYYRADLVIRCERESQSKLLQCYGLQSEHLPLMKLHGECGMGNGEPSSPKM